MLRDRVSGHNGQLYVRLNLRMIARLLPRTPGWLQVTLTRTGKRGQRTGFVRKVMKVDIVEKKIFFLLLPSSKITADTVSFGVHAQLLSCVQLFTTPWTVSCQAPLSLGFSRQEYWSGLPFPFPGSLPDPGIKPTSPGSPALAGVFITTEPPWKPGLHSVLEIDSAEMEFPSQLKILKKNELTMLPLTETLG